MTVLVIFLCMAFIGAGAGCIKRIYDKVEYRNRTRTNVKLENKIRTEWVQTIDEQLDKDNPKTGEMFSTLIFYYTKYGVPLFCRAFTTIEDAQRKLKKDKKLAEGCEWDYVCNLSTADSTSSIDFTGYERTARDYSKALSFYYLYNNYDRLYKYSCYTQDEVEQHLSNIKESYHQYPLIDAASPSKRLKTFVTEPKYKRIWYSYYENLIVLLTIRSLRENGFAISRDGVHESEWQEREQDYVEKEKLYKRYPWLYY